MNPIISPWVFYVIDVLESLVLTLQIVGVFAATASFVLFVYYIDEENDEKEKMNNRLRKIAFICCICMALAIFIPTKQTAYTMLIAQYTTAANIEKAGDTAEKAVQNLADLIVKTAQQIEKR